MRSAMFYWLVGVTLHASVADYTPYFEAAGYEYNIPPSLLKSIAQIESGGNPNAICRNDNGTRDYGLMQINSIHFKTLRQWGIDERNIMDPKVNIYVGSWILSEHIKAQGFNFKALGSYHSKTKVHQDKWLKRLIVALKTSPQVQ